MIIYYVIEDLGDGSSALRFFQTWEEAEKYAERNEEYCYKGVDYLDTDNINYVSTP